MHSSQRGRCWQDLLDHEKLKLAFDELYKRFVELEVRSIDIMSPQDEHDTTPCCRIVVVSEGWQHVCCRQGRGLPPELLEAMRALEGIKPLKQLVRTAITSLLVPPLAHILARDSLPWCQTTAMSHPHFERHIHTVVRSLQVRTHGTNIAKIFAEWATQDDLGKTEGMIQVRNTCS